MKCINIKTSDLTATLTLVSFGDKMKLRKLRNIFELYSATHKTMELEEGCHT